MSMAFQWAGKAGLPHAAGACRVMLMADIFLNETSSAEGAATVDLNKFLWKEAA